MNTTISKVARERLEMQGFNVYADRTLQQIRPLLRIGPAVCGLWMAVGLLAQSTWIIASLAPIAALGVILPVHPFDLPYNSVIRRWRGGPRIPCYGTPRRFACLMATVWVSITALALSLGYTTVALALGLAFLVSPVIYVSTDFCVASWIYQKAASPKRAPLPIKTT